MEGLKIIPQLFYDLMARIIPGSIAILALTIAGNVTLGQVRDKVFQAVPTMPPSSFFSITTFLVGAYLLGHFLGSFNDLFKNTGRWIAKNKLFSKVIISKAVMPMRIIWPKIFPSFSRTLRESLDKLCTPYLVGKANHLFKKTLHGEETTEEKVELDMIQYRDAIYLWYDWLRVQNADVGARLTKLRAEYHMLERIAYALFIALILHLSLWIGTKIIKPEMAINWYLVISSCLGFILSSRAAAKACWTFQWSIINHYILLNSESSKAKVLGVGK